MPEASDRNMCGIYGEVSLTDRPLSGEHRQDALAKLRHRGPDESGWWTDGRAFLGSCRLSIIDLEGGRQPIWNEDESLCIVYNGELYNFSELRRELEGKGHRFKTRSDTEVVLHAFEQWGPGCLARFNGMFAFAIWNARDASLFLCRDRLGEKPLYFLHDSTRLVFASETKAIIEDRSVPRRVDPKGLTNFLAFGHAVAPDTMYEGVKKLLPGHFLTIKSGRLTIERYWDVGDAPALTPGEHLADIRGLLEDSVRMRMLADVPVGAFLSGGIDSSAVVTYMKQHVTDVKTFALGFEEGGDYDQLEEARSVAQHLGTDHHELRVGASDLLGALETLVYHYDEPFGDAAAFPVYLLSCFARDHVKVVLVGDGGDELFGGYRRYAADRVASIYGRLPAFLTRAVGASVDHLPRFRRLKRAANSLARSDPALRYASWLEVFTDDLRREVLTVEPVIDPAVAYSSYYNALDGRAQTDHVNRLMYVDLKRILPDAYLEKVDKATMAASLEARVPFLDHRLVELAFRIPGSHKVRGLSTKRVLKRALRGVIPDWVIDRPKRGFSVPTDPWFRGDLSSFAAEVLFDPRTDGRGFFERRVVERLWNEHAEGRHVRDHQLWLLMLFELWNRVYLDRTSV